VKVHIIGTAAEVEAAIAALRAGLDGVTVSEPIGSGDTVMISVECFARLGWLAISRDEPPTRDRMRRIVADLDLAGRNNPRQRRPRRT
jgi:hypothetical protein